jgi:hypothetical protein
MSTSDPDDLLAGSFFETKLIKIKTGVRTPTI